MTDALNLSAITLYRKTDAGIQPISMRDYFAGRTIILFAVPGAFTPTCTAQHLPSYRMHFDALMAEGIDAVACLAVNDAHVMHAWGQSVAGKIDMLADMHGALASALGILVDMGEVMGKRANRAAFMIKDGVVKHRFIEEPKQFAVSSAEHMLSVLRGA